MVRMMAVACALALAGCATTGAATATDPLEGKQLDVATGRYGAWAQHVSLDGKPTYIWRRSYVVGSQPYYCELHIETGFRKTISRTSMQGNAGACQLFGGRPGRSSD